MRFLDFFAGVGGFRRGMELAGHECAGFCEWDKFATASYISMHCITDEQREYLASFDMKKRQKEILKEEYLNGEWYSNDIRNVRGGSMPMVECWCFGAPCQDFSLAGARKGLDGDRSSLIREVFRILREIREENRPEWLIYENVKGMLSSNRGFDYLAILLAMDELGYDCEWQVVNTKDFGPPQSRERVYTIGHIRTAGAAKVFPISGAHATGDICKIGNIDGFGRDANGRFYSTNGIAPLLITNGGGGHEPKIAVSMDAYQIKDELDYAHVLNARDSQGIHGWKNHPDTVVMQQIPVSWDCGELESEKDSAFTLTSRDGKGFSNIKGHPGNAVALGILRTMRSDYGKEIRKEYEAGNMDISRHEFLEYGVRDDGISNTIDTVPKDNYLAVAVPNEDKTIMVTLHDADGSEIEVPAVWYEKYKCYIAIRRLTPRECFRLQGWSDMYFDRAAFVNSDAQLYKQAGNGVTVNVVAAIANKMNEVMTKEVNNGKN